jgi:hypothetical protein
MALANSSKAFLNGVTVGAGDHDSGASVFVLNQYLATVAATTGLIQFQTYGRCRILEVGASLVANGTAGSTVLDLHTGSTKAGAATVLATAKLKIKAATTIGVATPTTLEVADNGFLRVDIDGVASGTKSGLVCWVVGERY